MNGESEQNGEAQSGERMTGQAWLFGFGVGAVILSLMLMAYLIGFDRGEDKGASSRPAAQKPGAPATTQPSAGGPGRELFVDKCGTCHTLSAAGTSGTTGPNLDALQPDEETVLKALENGGTGTGVMPTGLYKGKQAQEVAKFVSGSAGQ